MLICTVLSSRAHILHRMGEQTFLVNPLGKVRLSNISLFDCLSRNVLKTPITVILATQGMLQTAPVALGTRMIIEMSTYTGANYSLSMLWVESMCLSKCIPPVSSGHNETRTRVWRCVFYIYGASPLCTRVCRARVSLHSYKNPSRGEQFRLQ